MKLNKMKPRLAVLNTNRLPMLETKAGATPRTSGSTWMKTRRRIMLRDRYTCASCGLVRSDHDCDHVVPLEQGGADADCNLQLLCRSWIDEQRNKRGCHAEKSKAEAKERAGK